MKTRTERSIARKNVGHVMALILKDQWSLRPLVSSVVILYNTHGASNMWSCINHNDIHFLAGTKRRALQIDWPQEIGTGYPNTKLTTTCPFGIEENFCVVVALD